MAVTSSGAVGLSAQAGRRPGEERALSDIPIHWTGAQSGKGASHAHLPHSNASVHTGLRICTMGGRRHVWC